MTAGGRDHERRTPDAMDTPPRAEITRLPSEPIDPVDPGGPTEPQVNLADGALLRDQDKPEVWVMCGGARFWVPSGEEFAAMGYDWAKVQLVPPGTVAGISRLPRDGTLF